MFFLKKALITLFDFYFFSTRLVYHLFTKLKQNTLLVISFFTLEVYYPKCHQFPIHIENRYQVNLMGIDKSCRFLLIKEISI